MERCHRLVRRLAGLEIDLTAYAGQEIEIAIVYATDWGVQNLGVWLDDVSFGGEPALGFEAGEGVGAWEAGSLEGSPNQATWAAAGSTQTFQEGAVIGTKDLTFVDAGLGTAYQTSATRDTVYAGFSPAP